jgi:hypothetical protein
MGGHGAASMYDWVLVGNWRFSNSFLLHRDEYIAMGAIMSIEIKYNQPKDILPIFQTDDLTPR